MRMNANAARCRPSLGVNVLVAAEGSRAQAHPAETINA
jgi:hypothetical protein